MITVICGSGDHSNRLIQSSHFEAFCMENGYGFKILDFDDMAFFYQGCVASNPIKVLAKRFVSKALKGIRKIQNKTGIKFIKLFDYELIKPNSGIEPCDDSFVCGWNFRRNDLVKKYRDYFINKYALKKSFYENNELYKIIAEQKEKVTFVGLHIRRGDYKTWLNGAYYYEKEQYLEVFNKLNALLSKKNKKEVKFVIFSNEDVASWFKDCPNVIISKNQWFVDQFLMSQMDYLAGPMSTFTMWASYMGKVPLYYIEDPAADITLDLFEVKESAR